MRSDEFYMARALAVAERGRGRTSPNPLVGAVLVDAEGVVVGSGHHEIAGGPHAEIVALGAAGGRARGSTLFSTLEPCAHVGRTGPCAPRVAEAGVARVVIAVQDPNPLVSGRGTALLRARGVSVAGGVCEADARAINRPFFSVMTRRRPFVTMKVALSADGRTSEAPGVRTTMTSASANRFIHRERAEIDAIGVGSGTILVDDPRLTARGAYRHRPLVRVVFDTRLRTPAAAKLFSTLDAGPVIILTTPEAARSAPRRVAALTRSGAEIVAVERPPGAMGLIAGDAGGTHLDLSRALEQLAVRGLSALVVEGGLALHRSFWDAGLVDRVQIFRTPHHLGSRGPAWLPAVAAGDGWSAARPRKLGVDLLMEGYVHRAD